MINIKDVGCHIIVNPLEIYYFIAEDLVCSKFVTSKCPAIGLLVSKSDVVNPFGNRSNLTDKLNTMKLYAAMHSSLRTHSFIAGGLALQVICVY